MAKKPTARTDFVLFDIVYATGSSFGTSGPAALREGSDIVGQAMGGLISAMGRDGEPYSPVAVTIADHCASLNMVVGILAALAHRDRTGVGQKVEVSPWVAGVSLILAANLVDLLPNATIIPFTWLMAGAILGRAEALARSCRTAPVEARRAARARPSKTVI